MWNIKTPGIPDEFFDRTEKVPITKEEVRVIQISKAQLCPGQLVYDIGCGSGSITIEVLLEIPLSITSFSDKCSIVASNTIKVLSFTKYSLLSFCKLLRVT